MILTLILTLTLTLILILILTLTLMLTLTLTLIPIPMLRMMLILILILCFVLTIAPCLARRPLTGVLQSVTRPGQKCERSWDGVALSFFWICRDWKGSLARSSLSQGKGAPAIPAVDRHLGNCDSYCECGSVFCPDRAMDSLRARTFLSLGPGLPASLTKVAARRCRIVAVLLVSILLPVSVKAKLLRKKECPLERWLSEHRIRGWRTASAAGLHGKGLYERSVLFTDTGIHRWRRGDPVLFSSDRCLKKSTPPERRTRIIG